MLAAFQATPEYVEARHAYEEGPQRHRLEDRGSAAPVLTTSQVRQLEDTPGVRAVIPQYWLEPTGCETADPDDFCGRVFVGTAGPSWDDIEQFLHVNLSRAQGDGR